MFKSVIITLGERTTWKTNMLFLLKVGGEDYTQYFMIIGTYYSICLLAGPIINADYTLQMYIIMTLWYY